ncbi:hypothetical protein AAFF_G00113630 [Aldrovandia affinis]|uniref:Uncharacterized protein n=1 Tax=Aldrovandia affinis TaxID=143900 RepID=A0AAD7WBJ2_9TELE|nr:hypothetical protein AAFF_G00113630 [Aldrovandia affinis]
MGLGSGAGVGARGSGRDGGVPSPLLPSSRSPPNPEVPGPQPDGHLHPPWRSGGPVAPLTAESLPLPVEDEPPSSVPRRVRITE